jgi:hypothetical protein
VKEVHQIFDLVRLENISESGHGSTAIVNLMFDLLFFQAFPDSAQVRPKVSAVAIYAMAMLTPLFMKERGSGVLTFARVGVNNRSGRSWQATRQSYDNGQETESSTDSRRDFAVSLQRNNMSFCDGPSRMTQPF